MPAKIRANYKAFVLHLREYDKLGIPYGLNDLRRLAKKHNCPIPNEFKQKDINKLIKREGR